jgi:hypothetical protein
MPQSRAVQRKRSGLSIDLSGLAGSPEMAKANPQFLQDEESWRASTGDYKSKFDGSKPYKSPGFFGRLAKNPGDLKNTEYMLDKEAMLMEHGLKQDMEKVKLANELVRIGENTKAEQVIAEVKDGLVRGQQQQQHGFKLDQQAQDNLQRIGQIELTGNQTRLSDDNRSWNSKAEASQKAGFESNAAKTAQEYAEKNLRLGDIYAANADVRKHKGANNMIPTEDYPDDYGNLLRRNATNSANQAPAFLAAELEAKRAAARLAWIRSNSPSGDTDYSLPGNPITQVVPYRPPDGLGGSETMPMVKVTPTNVAPFVPPILDADAAAPGVTPGAGKVKITAKPDDEYDTAIKGVFNNTPFSHSSYKGATRGEMMDMFNMAVGADNGIMPESIGDSVFYSYPFGRLPIDEQQRLYNNLNPRQKRQTSLLLQNMSQGK